jgi:hypothetical protein
MPSRDEADEIAGSMLVSSCGAPAIVQRSNLSARLPLRLVPPSRLGTTPPRTGLPLTDGLKESI